MRLYLYVNEDVLGPYDLSDVLKLLQAGNINSETLSKSEDGDWVKLATLIPCPPQTQGKLPNTKQSRPILSNPVVSLVIKAAIVIAFVAAVPFTLFLPYAIIFWYDLSNKIQASIVLALCIAIFVYGVKLWKYLNRLLKY